MATDLDTAATANERPLPDERLRAMLGTLMLCRYFDERMEALYRQGRLPGAFYSGRGQEGTHVGAAWGLRSDDSLFPTHRDLSAQLTKGLDLNRVMAQYWGRIDGYLRGRDGNSHIGDWYGNRTYAVMSHLPIAYPVACGAALAYKRAGDDRVALAICGDGSTSNGRWHEALNMSSVFQLPVVWVVNNNQFAYSAPNPIEFHTATIAERASAYAMPGVRVDGGEVLEVFDAVRAALERARGGGGPTLIESVSLRWRGHAGHDPATYMAPELLEEYMALHDPIKNFQEKLLSWSVVTKDDIDAIAERNTADFEAAHAFALASPFPEPADAFLGNWTDDGYWAREPGRGGGTQAG
ncbi:MAG: thiamine pyrophosphate-dependent dehydrogenase E1 component subunit alpha [Actinomycetota bacterium]